MSVLSEINVKLKSITDWINSVGVNSKNINELPENQGDTSNSEIAIYNNDVNRTEKIPYTSGVQDLSGYQLKDKKNVPNGYAGLDSNGFVKDLNIKTPEQFGILSDGTDEAVKLQALLDLGGTIFLSKNYTTSVKLVMQPNSKIIGNGTLQQALGTIPTAILETSDDSSVSGITIRGVGDLTKLEIDVAHEIGEGPGIYFGPQNYQESIDLLGLGLTSGIINAGKRTEISDVKFYNLTKWAIELTQNATISTQQPIHTIVSNCLFYLNYGGLYLPERSEYQNFTSNTFKYNIYGVYNIGGNNDFTGNHIDHNRINMVLKFGINDTHGEVVGGSLNHGKLASLLVEKISGGHLFSGVSMFDGGDLGVYINESRGLRITGSVLGRMNVTNNGNFAEVGNEGVNTISNTGFGTLGATYTITENDTNGVSNLEMFDNSMLEGGDTTGWKNYILNNRKFDKDLVTFEVINSKNTFRQINASHHNIGGTSQNGSLAIKLPNGFSNQTVNLQIQITDLFGVNSKINISGYLTTAGGKSWDNVNANYNVNDKEYKISFGEDAVDNKPIIYIGESSTNWRFQDIHIERFSAHGGSLNSPKFYKYGWEYEVTNTLQNITNTTEIKNNQSSFVADFNDITYEYKGFIIASGSTNLPEAVDGVLEAIFKLPNSAFGIQRYTTVTGNCYVRGRNNSVFTAWSLLNNA